MIISGEIKNTLFWCICAINPKFLVGGIEIFKSDIIYQLIKKLGVNLI
jgi:hypothetical protein